MRISAEKMAGSFLVFCMIVIGAAQGALAGPGRASTEKPATLASEDQPMLLVLDRNNIQEGETAVLSVALSNASFVGRPETYPSDTLRLRELLGPDPDHLRRYAIEATRAGQYPILVRAAVKAEKDQAASARTLNRSVVLTVVRTVVIKEHGTLGGNAGVVIGAILGIVGSFLGVYFKDMMESRAAKRNQFLWLSNELVGRLEAARLDVKKRRKVNFEPWMQEVYSKFSALRRWGATPESGETLSGEVTQIEGLLREYNQRLGGVSVDDDLVADLEQRIGLVQKILTTKDAAD